MHVRRTCVAAAAAALTLLATSATAGAVSAWTPVTSTAGTNTVEIGYARGADGVLHIAYLDQRGTDATLVHRTLSPSGVLSAPVDVLASPWKTMDNPAVTVASDGTVQVWFSGIRTADTLDPYNGQVYVASSHDGGATWSLSGDVTTEDAYASTEVSAALGVDGTPYQSWSNTFGTYTHAGTNTATPARNAVSGCCGYSTALAVDRATGSVVLGWYSNVTNQNGLWWQAIAGAGAGAAQYLTGSGNAARDSGVSLGNRMPLVERAGGGVYAVWGGGYPTFTRVLVQRFGWGAPFSLEKAAPGHIGEVGAARASDGRIWAIWDDEPGHAVWARRSNPAGTVFGARTMVRLPGASPVVYRLSGDAGTGPLDVFATIGIGGGTPTMRARMLPGITIVAPARVRRARTFTVRALDAGAALAGTRIRAFGVTVTTNAAGVARVHVPARGLATAVLSATHVGYAPAASTLRVSP